MEFLEETHIVNHISNLTKKNQSDHSQKTQIKIFMCKMVFFS